MAGIQRLSVACSFGVLGGMTSTTRPRPFCTPVAFEWRVAGAVHERFLIRESESLSLHYYLTDSNLNFCPPTAAATITPALGRVNTATPCSYFALTDAPDAAM